MTSLQKTKRVSWVSIILWVLRVAVITLVIYGSAVTLSSGKYAPSSWISLLIAGLAQGSIYALIALGYSLVYGIMLMIYFAHGEVYMAGAFVSFFVADALEQSGFLQAQPLVTIFILLLSAMATSTLVALILERVAYRKLQNAPRMISLITAIGASFFLQYTFRGFFGSGFKAYPEFGTMWGRWTFGSVTIQVVQVVVAMAAILMMGGLYWFVEKTNTGK